MPETIPTDLATDWESLYQRGLPRPEYTNLAGDTFYFVRYAHGFAWQPKPPLTPFVQLDVAHNWQASCGHAAVRWLAQQADGSGLEIFAPGDGSGWLVCNGPVDGDEGATLDESVCRAVKALLDARAARDTKGDAHA